MNDKTLDLLTSLADKFGTTAEHLWGVLVKQAGITACLCFTESIALIVALLWLFHFIKTKTTKGAPDNYGRSQAEWDEDGAGIAWCIGGILGIIMFCCAISDMSTAITAAFNPEYWALKQILA